MAGDGSENGREERRFTILDGLVLVFVAALVISSGRAAQGLWHLRDREGMDGTKVTRATTYSLALVSPSLILLPYQLSRRDDRRRLQAGAPGLLVHVIPAVVVAVQCVGWISQATMTFFMKGRPALLSEDWDSVLVGFVFGHMPTYVLMGIVICWVTLAIVGRWKTEAAWDDRLGRLLAGFWLCYYLFAGLIFVLP